MTRKIPRARLTDPQTSRQAAASVHDLRESQRIILSALAHFGEMTDEEVYTFISGFHAISVSGARTRRKELVDMGLVRDSGQRGLTENGRRTIKWEITDEARGRAREVDESDPALDQRGARQRSTLEAREGRDVHPPSDRGARQRRLRLPR